MIKGTQMPARFIDEINKQIGIFESEARVQNRNEIPDTTQIPIKDPTHWVKVPNVICVFADMKNSTKLSASKRENSTARAYQLYTGTIVDIFHSFDAPYIDVKGDGAFALFNEGQAYRALAAAVTVKTFTSEVFVPRIQANMEAEIGSHLGIDQKSVLVKKLGLIKRNDRSDRQNEVWAGKPVNMSAKLASLSDDGELIVSDRFFANIQNDLALMSCGCNSKSGEPSYLWTEIDLSEDERFDFDVAYKLKSHWCGEHGRDYCEAILNLD